jgi:hypothetical protein
MPATTAPFYSAKEQMSSKQKAPVVIIDPTVLGDRLPRDQDSVAQKTEDTINFRAKNHKVADQDFLVNQDMAQVNYLDPFEFIRRLRKLNASLLFGVGGVQGCVSLWTRILDDEPTSATFGKFVEMPISCGFRVDGPIPEFSWLETDKWNIATREGERGWRTVLIRLITAGFLSYKAVKNEFGEPLGLRGKLWHQQLREYKN